MGSKGDEKAPLCALFTATLVPTAGVATLTSSEELWKLQNASPPPSSAPAPKEMAHSHCGHRRHMQHVDLQSVRRRRCRSVCSSQQHPSLVPARLLFLLSVFFLYIDDIKYPTQRSR
jgi:hypothetical protein